MVVCDDMHTKKLVRKMKKREMHNHLGREMVGLRNLDMTVNNAEG
jgi:hypothetical protein